MISFLFSFFNNVFISLFLNWKRWSSMSRRSFIDLFECEHSFICFFFQTKQNEYCTPTAILTIDFFSFYRIVIFEYLLLFIIFLPLSNFSLFIFFFNLFLNYSTLGNFSFFFFSEMEINRRRGCDIVRDHLVLLFNYRLFKSNGHTLDRLEHPRASNGWG